jgi:hypothetical protein
MLGEKNQPYYALNRVREQQYKYRTWKHGWRCFRRLMNNDDGI